MSGIWDECMEEGTLFLAQARHTSIASEVSGTSGGRRIDSLSLALHLVSNVGIHCPHTRRATLIYRKSINAHHTHKNHIRIESHFVKSTPGYRQMDLSFKSGRYLIQGYQKRHGFRPLRAYSSPLMG